MYHSSVRNRDRYRWKHVSALGKNAFSKRNYYYFGGSFAAIGYGRPSLCTLSGYLSSTRHWYLGLVSAEAAVFRPLR